MSQAYNKDDQKRLGCIVEVILLIIAALILLFSKL